MSPRWHAAMGFALTGEVLDVTEPGKPDVAACVAALTDLGWTSERLAAHAREEVAAERIWPHPVPDDLRQGCSPSQLQAALLALRHMVGLDVLITRGPSPARALNADERRLLADVPPHHVR